MNWTIRKYLEENKIEIKKCVQLKKVLEAEMSPYQCTVDNENKFNNKNKILALKLLQIEKERVKVQMYQNIRRQHSSEKEAAKRIQSKTQGYSTDIKK